MKAQPFIVLIQPVQTHACHTNSLMDQSDGVNIIIVTKSEICITTNALSLEAFRLQIRNSCKTSFNNFFFQDYQPAKEPRATVKWKDFIRKGPKKVKLSSSEPESDFEVSTETFLVKEILCELVLIETVIPY